MEGTTESVERLRSAGSGLGLRAGEVAVVPHDQGWASLYAAVEVDLREVLSGDAELAHIGSTSVPGLAAKPILDIAVGLPLPIDTGSVVPWLQTLGLAYQGDLGIYGGLFFTVESEPEVVVMNLHVVDVDDFQWRWYLAFRDGLRADEDLRAEYASLKRELAESLTTDRDAYNKAKFDWVLATASRLGDGYAARPWT